jgi:hypothetical protein
MITIQHIEEGLSRAYVDAVVSRAGMTVSIPTRDYGIDGSIRKIGFIRGKRCETGIGVDFQLKSSHSRNIVELFPSRVKYRMEVDAYNNLVFNSATPRILILVLLAYDSDSWVSTNDHCLSIRRTAWWLSLRGRPESTNQESVTVEIPRGQKFDVTSLKSMIARIEQGGRP